MENENQPESINANTTATEPSPSVNSPQPITPTQSASVPQPPSLPKQNKKFVVIILAVICLVLAAATAYLAMSYNTAKKDKDTLQSQIDKLDADAHELPEGAIKVSECVPNMGYHYIDKDGDPQLGPFYLVSKQGEVIGLEFMFNKDMMTTIPNAEIALEVVTAGPQDLNDWQFKNIEISRAPEGHPGFEEDHYDLHLYTVTPEVQAQSCI